ncbi:MAG TPA: NAD(P)H-hydrate dehydratase [Dehalococcoidia bacterium]|nr:NAD(P)H-hydrate dehydratase [Dehalococcoidia bacterium]
MKLVTAAQMRQIEAAAFASGISPEGLMETAGRGVALAVASRLGGAAAQRIVVLVGPGNNGGDGLVAARHLYDMGAEVHVYLLTPRGDDDANMRAIRERDDIDIVDLNEATVASELAPDVQLADAVIDAVLGIGRGRPLEGAFAAALDALKQRKGLLLAVDLPTGLDADTGAVDPHCPAADATLTFGYSKLGLHLLPGAAHAGDVEVMDIGLDPALGDEIDTEIMTADWARARLPARPLVSNKGTFGRVMVVAGSESYTGAATLACLGALRAGAGLVTLAALPSVRAAVAAQLPEVTYLTLPEDHGAPSPEAAGVVAGALPGYDVLLLGPGLGLSDGAQALVRGVLAAKALQELPVVIDADALNTLSRSVSWHETLTARAVLTPHPGELARLAHSSVAEVQSRRLDVARERAAAWGQTVVLKGSETVVAGASGRTLLSPFANPALATAGTGDVLAGAIAGLIAQDVAPFDAAGLGVYLHAAAAELYAQDYGPSGLLASEVAAGVARAAARLRRGD